MSSSWKIIAAIVFLAALLVGCAKDKDTGPNRNIITNLGVVLNPNGTAPLTALIRVTTNTPASVRLRVIGQHGEASDVVHDFPEVSTIFDLPVLGLYPSYSNQVQLTFFSSSASISFKKA